MSQNPTAPMGKPGDIINWPMLKISYETDPECIAKLLPPGVEPGKNPTVKIIIYNFPVLGEPEYGVVVNVAADVDGVEGEYTLGIGIDQEAAISGSKERWGQPKFFAETKYYRLFDEVKASVTHQGYTFLEFSGKVKGPVEITEDLQDFEVNEWWVKYSRAVDMMPYTFDFPPHVVQVYSRYGTAYMEEVEGTLKLNESPWDPVAQLLPVKSEPKAFLWTPTFKARNISLNKPLDPKAFWPFADTIGSSMWPGENGAPSKKLFKK